MNCQELSTEKSYITERMTDDEIEAFNKSILFCTNNSQMDSDYFVANGIRRELWASVHQYLSHFYEEDENAEQDH